MQEIAPQRTQTFEISGEREHAIGATVTTAPCF